MTSLMVNSTRHKTLVLYAIKWVFDTSKLDQSTLKKMDEEKFSVA